MSFRKSIMVLSAVMLTVLIVVAPFSDADIAKETNCNNVSFVMFDENVDIGLNTTQTLVLHITNDNSSLATVNISMENNDSVRLSENINITIKKDTTVDQNIVFATNLYSVGGDYVLKLNVDVICNGTEESAQIDVNVHVTSKYSSAAYYNKFFGVFENNLPSPCNEPSFTAAVTMALWVIIAAFAAFGFVRLLNYIFNRLCDRGDMFKKWTVAGIFVYIVLYGITNSLLVLGYNEKVVTEMSSAFDVIYILVGSMVVWEFYKAVVYWGLHAIDDHDDSVDGFDITLIPLFNLIGKVIITAAAVGLLLSTFGLDISTIIAGAGIAGLGISLGVKPAINELLSGFMVLITRPFKVGDTVVIGDNDALQVTSVGVLKTTFRTTYTNEYITMSNSIIASSKIVNRTPDTVKYRIYIYVKVPKGTNLVLARKLLKEVAYEHPHIVKDSSVARPVVNINDYRSDGGIKMRLAVYVDNYGDQGSIGGELREGIVKKFRKNGLSIPLVQEELIIHNNMEEVNESMQS